MCTVISLQSDRGEPFLGRTIDLKLQYNRDTADLSRKHCGLLSRLILSYPRPPNQLPKKV